MNFSQLEVFTLLNDRRWARGREKTGRFISRPMAIKGSEEIKPSVSLTLSLLSLSLTYSHTDKVKRMMGFVLSEPGSKKKGGGGEEDKKNIWDY